jgi:hypothetical protein
MGHIHHGGVAEADERAWIAEATALLRGRFGDALRGWHSPAHSESHRTPDLVAEAGYAWTSGWANDDMPYAFATRAGTLTAMPLSQDLADQRMLHQQNMATGDFTTAVLAAHAALGLRRRRRGEPARRRRAGGQRQHPHRQFLRHGFRAQRLPQHPWRR